jgi:hypothetical protein
MTRQFYCLRDDTASSFLCYLLSLVERDRMLTWITKQLYVNDYGVCPFKTHPHPGGEADASLLEHLRGPGPHCRGCWATDLLRGNE